VRKDAQLRRERLVSAAADVFQSDGYHVPLEIIAERAEVGRATLYRNFPDRASLAIAVMEAHLDDLAAKIAELGGRPDTFFLALRELASLALATGALTEELRAEGRSPVAIDKLRARVQNLLAEPLDQAKAAGLVRDDFQIGDINALAKMVAAGARDGPGHGAPIGLTRAVELLIRGLKPL
jgi:AcrR family transcriptional regulator